jgi:hypothetical protein
MSLAVIAEPDLRERLRCIRIIAQQSSVSAIGAANWGELEQTFGESGIGFIVYAHTLPGSPEDAVEQLLERTPRLVLAVDEGEAVEAPSSVTRAVRPIPEETLVLLARGSSRPSAPVRANFNPVDFIQMICMSGASQVVVVSQEGADTGIIEVRSGEVWTAFDSLGIGEEAFARLIRPEMRARIGPMNGSTKDRTIFKGLNELMLESLRRIDEGEISRPPPLSAAQVEVATSTPEQIAQRVAELSGEARRLLMQRNYDEAARALINLSELDPASHLVRANLEQLRRLGYPK